MKREPAPNTPVEAQVADDVVVLPEVKVLRLQPGDTLIAKLGDRGTLEQAEELRQRLLALFPDYEVLVTIGFDLEVARQSDGRDDRG